MSRRGRPPGSRRQGHVTPRLKTKTPIEIDLLMECVDEKLSTTQIEAQRQAEREYQVALKKVQNAYMKKTADILPPNEIHSPDVIPSSEEDEIIVVDGDVSDVPSSLIPKRRGRARKQTFPPNLGEANDLITIITAPPVRYTKRQKILHSSPLTGPIVPGQIPVGLVSSQETQATPLSKNTQLETDSKCKNKTGSLDKVKTVISPPQEIIPGTYGLGIKRPQSGTVLTEPETKKPKSKYANTNDSGPLIPLDEYYYGKKEGDPAYREEKGEFRFKCWYCHKMLHNNTRIMMHMQGHIDAEKQQNLDLSDITQCKHCYKQFDTPFEMQGHVEKIHQNKSNVLVCRICEKDLDSQTTLRNHMKVYHTSCEMPYICQLCNFRSSIYNDVVDHFKKRHDSSQHLMCLYCLKVFKMNFSKVQGWGFTHSYYLHLQKHQMKGLVKKCTSCKLTFVNKAEAKCHKQKDHMPNYKGTKTGSLGLSTTTHNQEQVMIHLPDTKGGQPKSLNAPFFFKSERS